MSMLKLEFNSYVLDFNFQARTSRGQISERKVWFIQIFDELGRSGYGEIAPIDRLSPEELSEVPLLLEKISSGFRKYELPINDDTVFSLVQELVPVQFPSVRFGFEMAFLDLINGGEKKIFSKGLGSVSIPINGLVWMGDVDFMQNQIKEKLEQGFRCLKLKVGALDFKTELDIIKSLRRVSDDLVIRLDANGGFQTNEVLSKLKQLAPYNIHSIEQPILPMQPEAMELLCKKSEIPIALDEELIHIFSSEEKMELLQELKPQFIVLKPTLHGGFSGVKEWIDLAEMHGIHWWITSYLESNIGLNAIAQFTSQYENEEFHGLGTGNLYSNNITSPIMIKEGKLVYASSNVWGEIETK